MPGVIEEERKEIALMSCTGTVIKVSHEAIQCSEVIKAALRVFGEPRENQAVVVASLTTENLERICEWMEFHKDDDLDDYVITFSNPSPNDPDRKGITVIFSEWDKLYFGGMTQSDRTALLRAAQELEIFGLMEMTRRALLFALIPKGPDDDPLKLKVPPEII